MFLVLMALAFLALGTAAGANLLGHKRRGRASAEQAYIVFRVRSYCQPWREEPKFPRGFSSPGQNAPS